MDMKKILSALDNISERTVQGTNDMKKFVSIIRESSEPVDENIISGFEEGSVGGDANAFLIAADEINDLVMSQVEKIKINADEASLRDMMEKFNAFMTAYHNVGKGILQPDMFNDSLGESYPKHQDLSGISTDKLKAYIAKQSQQQGSGEGTQVKRVRAELQRRSQGVAEAKPIPKDPNAPESVQDRKTGKWYDPSKEFEKTMNKPEVQAQMKRMKNEGLTFLDYLNLAEATGKQKGVDGKACWDGYKRMGTKKKGGKTVDNCVPTGKK
jgi:hypothetical protein